MKPRICFKTKKDEVSTVQVHHSSMTSSHYERRKFNQWRKFGLQLNRPKSNQPSKANAEKNITIDQNPSVWNPIDRSPIYNNIDFVSFRLNVRLKLNRPKKSRAYYSLTSPVKKTVKWSDGGRYVMNVVLNIYNIHLPNCYKIYFIQTTQIFYLQPRIGRDTRENY